MIHECRMSISRKLSPSPKKTVGSDNVISDGETTKKTSLQVMPPALSFSIKLSMGQKQMRASKLTQWENTASAKLNLTRLGLN